MAVERVFIEKGIKNMELNEFLGAELYKAGFTRAEVVRTPLVTRIVVNVAKPSIAIGKGGQNIRGLTATIEKRFKIENPQLEIKEVENPQLNSTVMANRIKMMIERGFSWRSIAYRVVKDIVDAKAQGVELILSGKLAGKGGRKRRQRVAVGYMKKVGDQVKYVDYAKATAYPKQGAIGIKLRIVRPDIVFPDKIKIGDVAGSGEKKIEEEMPRLGGAEGALPAAASAGAEAELDVVESGEKGPEAAGKETGKKEVLEGKESGKKVIEEGKETGKKEGGEGWGAKAKEPRPLDGKRAEGAGDGKGKVPGAAESKGGTEKAVKTEVAGKAAGKEVKAAGESTGKKKEKSGVTEQVKKLLGMGSGHKGG